MACAVMSNASSWMLHELFPLSAKRVWSEDSIPQAYNNSICIRVAGMATRGVVS